MVLGIPVSQYQKKKNPIVTKGKKIGTYVGRVAVRSIGSFNISTQQGLVQGISHKYCQIIHQKDGYSYAFHAP
ncbi:MAG: hypothetical protein QNJ64_03725 [Crocosphaera sp.]|nr:hypothetical protein [Crocosphaera sp.]